MQNDPKISIITVVFNGKSLIEGTIKSVAGQTYSNIEYIIIDGGSTDGTLEIIKNYQSKITISRSEKDNGIYDAMNKGLRLATGDYVLFLNAGDELYTPDTLTNVFSLSPDADVYYGNTAVVNEQGTVLGDRRLKPPAKLTWKSLKYGMCVSHQSFIAKRSLCDLYNLDFSISADIDWVINVLKRSKKIVNTNNYVSKFLEGGTSNKQRTKALKERFLIMKKQYGLFQTLWNHLFIILRYPIHKFTGRSMT
jgi:glycosyltransferase involved in cell wall biosynthesis